jgi:hypothetical protein
MLLWPPGHSMRPIDQNRSAHNTIRTNPNEAKAFSPRVCSGSAANIIHAPTDNRLHHSMRWVDSSSPRGRRQWCTRDSVQHCASFLGGFAHCSVVGCRGGVCPAGEPIRKPVASGATPPTQRQLHRRRTAGTTNGRSTECRSARRAQCAKAENCLLRGLCAQASHDHGESVASSASQRSAQ